MQFPVPPPGMDDLRVRLEQAITRRTKVLHFCHMTNLTGQVFPVADICRMARARGIQTIVDGAHAYGHFPFKLSDLECDDYGTGLHKWLLAPIGTGGAGSCQLHLDHVGAYWEAVARLGVCREASV